MGTGDASICLVKRSLDGRVAETLPSVLEHRLKPIQISTQRWFFHEHKLQRGWLLSYFMGSILDAESALPLLVALSFPWMVPVGCTGLVYLLQRSPAQHGRIAGNMKNKQGILAALCHSGLPKCCRVAAKLGHLSKYFEWV